MEGNEAKPLSSRKRSLIFICLIVSGVASATLATAMTTALPELVRYFGVSTSTGQWVTSGYSLAMGMVMPLTAFLITRFPTKKLYLTGIAGFIVGLLLSIFAGNFGVMMLGRVLQACGNGVLMSAAQVVIKKIFVTASAALLVSNFGMGFLSMNTPLWVAAALNVIRNTAIGSLMMPLLTWGISNVSAKKVADASSLLTSFRTIAGAIGSAVFVGIMTSVSVSTAAVYGDKALMHGMNVSYLWMTAGSLLLLLIAVFGVRRKTADSIT